MNKSLPVLRRGFSLLDAVIALAILAMGMLSMTSLQARLIAQGAEARQRMAAALLSDELLNMMLVDTPNAACYTLPAAGACGSATARANTDAWGVRALATLPGSPTATSTLAGDRMTVTLRWTGTGGGDLRIHQVVSDARGN